MSVNKKGLSFFLLLAAVISGGLIALPLRTLEAKERSSFPQASSVAAHAGLTNLAKVSGQAATVMGSYHPAQAPSSKWPNSSLLTSLFLPQLSTGSLAISNVAGRTVRIVGSTITAGQNGTVNIEFDAQGDENAIGFSVDFDATKLTYVSTKKGIDAVNAGATLNTNPNLAASGHLGYALAVDAGTTFPAGTLQLVQVTFRGAATGNGSTAINFGDSPVPHEITDDGHTGSIIILPADYVPGTVTINALAPTLTSVSPVSATTGGPAFTLTVNGTGFASGSVVRINGSNRPTTLVSSTQLTALIDATDIQTAGSYPIDVFTPAPGGGTSSAINVAVNNATLTGITPSPVTAGGPAFTLTANGSGFVSTSVVRFNGSDRPTTLVSSSQLTAQVSGTDIQTGGSFPITVSTTSGAGTSNAVNLAVNNPVPTLSSLSPSSTVAGGPAFTLTVNGTAFTAGSVVRFNGIDCATNFVSSTQLTALITADISAAGTAQVTVFNPLPGGGASSPLSFTISTNPALRIVRVAGATFLAGQNNTISVEFDAQGDENALGFSLNFDPTKISYVSRQKGIDTINDTVNVNPNEAANGHLGIAIAKSAGEVFPAGTRQLVVLTFSVPLAASGSTVVSFGDDPIAREITDPGNTGHIIILGATYASGTININHPAPTLTSISPTNAIAGGSDFTLTVSGNNFVTDSVVKLNGSNRPTTFVSGIQLTAQINAADIQAAGTIPVTVFTPGPGGGTSSSINLEIDNPVPVIGSLTPASATAGGAALTLTIDGINFVNGSIVRFNGSDRPTAFVSSSQLTAQVTLADLQTAGAASVLVFNPTPGGGLSSAASFAINNPLPVLGSVLPTSAEVGGAAFTLTITGSNFVSGSVIKWDGSERATSLVSSTQLTAQITAADIQSTGIFSITVFNPGPGGGTSSIIEFRVINPAPSINNLAPASATLGGADFTLTVSGAGFVNGSVVKFNGNDRTTTFVGSTQLTAQINAADIQAAGVFGVTVVNPAPGGGASAPLNFTVNNPVPTISSLSSTSAVAGDPAFTLTVNGSDFINGSVVKFNGNDRSTNFVSSTQLTAQITAADLATPGTFSVTVVNPPPGGGASGSVNFTVNNPVPTLSGLSQTTATLGDAAFTLAVTGSNFVNGSVVKVNGSDRVTSVLGATQLTAQITTADLAAAGTFAVLVFNPAPGGGSSNTLDFTVNNPAPTLSSISPTSAIVGGSTFTLTVNGSKFVDGSVIKVQGNDRVTSFVNNTRLTAQVLDTDIQAVGTLSIEVQNPAPGGGTSGAISFAVNNPVPAITTLVPDSANLGGADFTLSIHGAGFLNGSVVQFNGNDRTTNFISSSQLTAQITAADIQAAGLFEVTVTNPAPGGGASSAVTFTVKNPVPTISSLAPASALAGDAQFTLTVNGANFVNGSVVRWNGANRTTTFVGSGQLTALIDANDIQNSGIANVSVLNPTPGGGPSAEASFTINNLSPVLNSIAPTSTIAGGPGFALTVNGSHFFSGSVIRFNGSDRTTTFVSGTQLTAQITVADIQNAGTASISVFNRAPGGGSSDALNLSINNPVPSITTLSPSSAIAGDGPFTLAVNGANFVIGSVIRWNGTNRTTTFVNATQLTTEIPAADIQSVGAVMITVLNAAPGGGTSEPATFSVVKSNEVPSIGTLSPVRAIAGSAAFTLTVSGSNFISDSVVKFNGSDRNTSFVSDTQVTAQITAADIQSAGTFHVTVFNPAPGGGLSNSVDFPVVEPNPVPSISTLTPASATTGGAAFTLTVRGNNFVDGSVVRWNGSTRTTSFVSSTQLTSQITAADIQAAGTYQVTVFNPEPVGGESNATNFVVADRPDPAKLEFSSATYELAEEQNRIEITVVRTGNMSVPVTVDFATEDGSAFIPCGVATGGADQRCDYATTGGTLSFAPGEASKSFALLNTDDAYVEGNETLTLTLSNPTISDPSGATSSDGAILGPQAQATLLILDNDTVPPTSNPIDDARYFVNQQYLDFLSRLPDQEGIDYWTDQITQCGTDAACIHSRRIGVSGAFFVEPEFQQTGSVVYRLYKAAYGARPTYKQFMPDRSQLVGGLQLPTNTLNFAKLFVARPAFKAAYPDSLTPSEFVNQLFTTAGLMNNSQERQQQINALIDALSTVSMTRAQVLLDVIEIPEFKQREYNPSFVSMEYFGYLRRDPEEEGFQFWLNVLNNREPNNYRGMICSFITSIEYQQRFSSVVTRSNADCGQ